MMQLKEYFQEIFNKVGDVCDEKKKEPFAEQDVAQANMRKEVPEKRYDRSKCF